MLKRFLFVIVLFIPLSLVAQISINIQLPPSGVIQKSQLWNLTVINNSPSALNATISLVLQESQTGMTLFSAITNTIVLPKGVRILSSTDLQPIQYQNSSAISNNYLPVGSFIACYTVTKSSDDPQTLAAECTAVNISPVSPPLLVTPMDESVIKTTTPQFTWLAPAPLEMYNNLNFDLTVAEIFDGQLAEEALLYNSPAYHKINLTSTFESYPSTFSKLMHGRSYAWRVVARNGLSAPIQTDTWTFTISNDTIQQTSISKSYILLKNESEASGVTYITSREVNIKYYSFDKPYDAIVRIKSADGKVVKQYTQKLKYGDNFFTLNLNYQFVKDKVYRVELIDRQSSLHITLFNLK